MNVSKQGAGLRLKKLYILTANNAECIHRFNDNEDQLFSGEQNANDSYYANFYFDMIRIKFNLRL